MKSSAVYCFAILAIHTTISWGASIPAYAGTHSLYGNSRITNGQDAVQGAHPYQVSLWWGYPPSIDASHFCGGAIISNEWVVTAGHCLYSLPNYGTLTVYAGKYRLNTVETGQQSSTVKQQIIHPSYIGDANPHDIGLLRLNTPFTFTSTVAAIALPTQNLSHTGNVVLTGWGSISLNETDIFPNILQFATVPIVTNTVCYNALYNLLGKTTLDEYANICTGSSGNVGVAFCSGDSGGPIAQMVNQAWQLVGIVSWGAYPCGLVGIPSVYTRVSSYTNWINTQLATKSS